MRADIAHTAGNTCFSPGILQRTRHPTQGQCGAPASRFRSKTKRDRERACLKEQQRIKSWTVRIKNSYIYMDQEVCHTLKGVNTYMTHSYLQTELQLHYAFGTRFKITIVLPICWNLYKGYGWHTHTNTYAYEHRWKSTTKPTPCVYDNADRHIRVRLEGEMFPLHVTRTLFERRGSAHNN